MREFFRVWHSVPKKIKGVKSFMEYFDGFGSVYIDERYGSHNLAFPATRLNKPSGMRFVSLMLAEGAFLMQYAGFRDKNGTRIFVGDIVRCENGYIGVIVFREGCFRLEYAPYQQSYSTAEVIGNVHENPKLLKEKKKD